MVNATFFFSITDTSYGQNTECLTRETRRDGSGSGSGQRTCGRSTYLTLYYGRPLPKVSLSKFSCVAYIREPRYSRPRLYQLWPIGLYGPWQVFKVLLWPNG